MEITIDLYKVGYFLGRYGTRTILYFGKAKLAMAGYREASKIAKTHKIDATNPAAVTDNLFECLQYID